MIRFAKIVIESGERTLMAVLKRSITSNLSTILTIPTSKNKQEIKTNVETMQSMKDERENKMNFIWVFSIQNTFTWNCETIHIY